MFLCPGQLFGLGCWTNSFVKQSCSLLLIKLLVNWKQLCLNLPYIFLFGAHSLNDTVRSETALYCLTEQNPYPSELLTKMNINHRENGWPIEFVSLWNQPKEKSIIRYLPIHIFLLLLYILSLGNQFANLNISFELWQEIVVVFNSELVFPSISVFCYTSVLIAEL